MSRAAALVLAVCGCCCVVSAQAAAVSTTPLQAASVVQPVLTEFVAKNELGPTDEDGRSSDWMIITNPSPTQWLKLQGWALTTSAEPPYSNAWPFPQVRHARPVLLSDPHAGVHLGIALMDSRALVR
jgi:hypothetical protein